VLDVSGPHVDLADPALPGEHPKDQLYRDVYDPLTVAWFDAMRGCPEAVAVVDDARTVGLAETLVRLNDIGHWLVDGVLARMDPKNAADMQDTMMRYRDEVLWVDHEAPEPEPAAIRAALAHKFKRNASLGVIEALICLESAYTLGRERLGLSGKDLSDMIRRSRQLYASLAVLHDDQDGARLAYLTGITGHLRYPDIGYADVLEHRLHVPAERFMVREGPDGVRLRFAAVPVRDVALTSPVKRCPAHRAPRGDGRTGSLNDELWDLLIHVYTKAGRFD